MSERRLIFKVSGNVPSARSFIFSINAGGKHALCSKSYIYALLPFTNYPLLLFFFFLLLPVVSVPVSYFSNLSSFLIPSFHRSAQQMATERWHESIDFLSANWKLLTVFERWNSSKLENRLKTKHKLRIFEDEGDLPFLFIHSIPTATGPWTSFLHYFFSSSTALFPFFL